MKEIKIGRHTVNIWESAEDMPVVRWNKMQKLLMLDSGIGSDIEAIEGKVRKIQSMVKSGKTDEVSTELDNLNTAFHLINAGTNPKSLAFATLVHDIDGELCEDISDEGLSRVIERLEDLTEKDVRSITYRVKKKLQKRLVRFSRRLSDRASKSSSTGADYKRG